MNMTCNRYGDVTLVTNDIFRSKEIRFNASDAVSFDEYLVCHRRRTKNAPRRTVIMKFFGEQVTANRNDMFKLLLGIFHLLPNSAQR